MGWSLVVLSLVILCSVSSGSSANKTAVVAQAASIKAKERVKKLGDLCPDIKSSMRPRHCADLLRAGQTTSGLYNIFLGKDDVKGKVVYCDMATEGGGWTVIQRRGQFGNRVFYFYRNWTEYATGFGDPAKEYWFGNRALHALKSNDECMRLKIVLKNHTGESISLDYDCFKVGSEKEHFEMQLGQYLGPDGDMRPRHCTDHLRAGQTTSGLYNIFVGKDDVKGKVVYCDMDTDGGGWMVIQRRGQFGNSIYHFYRNWTEYATGFGDPAKEYWFGNRALHALTSNAECMELRIVLRNHTGENVSLDYESFKVGSEKDHFKMRLGGYLGPRGWDSLYNCNHSQFSTFDRDHDNTASHCAEKYRGGWWYNSCHLANLNGLNLNGPHDSYADGIEWSTRDGSGFLYHYSYPSVTMMTRPVTMNTNHESGYVHY
ncbi:hypothetical protein HPB49_010170 [Dermacentor silvarum]|uniref:Uncharacterized protein n=1 Tax=Dermacentor silvarum TaxID=543639 RepID=A0ACB8D4P4_DERSI|nr:hypothetical protein HPB49_010170 [Dermacentor silvarum]